MAEVREMLKDGWKTWVNASGFLMADGWRKVSESGGSYSIAYLFNVNTKECASVCVYDYDDPRNEDDFWRNVGFDDIARIEWNKARGVVAEGLTAKVVKGRKVPVGYTGKVVKIRKVYDRYDRWVANYAVFEDGTSTNVDNCVLSEEA